MVDRSAALAADQAPSPVTFGFLHPLLGALGFLFGDHWTDIGLLRQRITDHDSPRGLDHASAQFFFDAFIAKDALHADAYLTRMGEGT